VNWAALSRSPCSGCRKLLNLGLLENKSEASAKSQSPQGRVRGNVFYLRFKIFDPDKFLEKLLPRVRFAFNPMFAWLSVCVILLGAFVTLMSWQEIHHSLPTVRVESIFWHGLRASASWWGTIFARTDVQTFWRAG
jgi:hypothetical protein